MRWFKHISNSHNDEILSELMDEFGAEGYGVWWLILEKIAQLMDESDRTSARFSVKVWANSAKVSAKKFQNIVTFLEKKQRFSLKRDGNYLTIDCPKLLKYRDEWTERLSKKAKKTPEQLPSVSRESPVQESESESDTDIYKDDDDRTPVDNYKKLLADRGFYLNHLINGKTLEMFQAWIKDSVTIEEASQAMDRADAQLGARPSMPSYYRNIPYQIREELRRAQEKASEPKQPKAAAKDDYLHNMREELKSRLAGTEFDDGTLGDLSAYANAKNIS
jgi:hypothetical protein